LPYIQKLGIENIRAHNYSLVQRLQKEVPRLGFKPLTPPEARTPIVSFAIKEPESVIARVKKANINIKVERHLMRISPSIYNDQEDIDKLLNALS
jgi:selenocysteine lyase/cysteine desulfurase